MVGWQSDRFVRLLLDEHLSHRIASELRRTGHDCIAVAERDDLRGRTDRAIAEAATAEHRAIVTLDIRDHLSILRDFLRLGVRHSGLVLLTPRAWDPSLEAVGPLVRALADLLSTLPSDDALAGRAVWLRKVM